MAEYKKFIKKEDLGRIQRWLICGPNAIFVQDALEIAYEHIFSLGLETSKYVVFGENAEIDELRRILLNLDFFSDRALVVMFEPEKFHDWEELVPILKSLPDNKFFIAVSEEPSGFDENVVNCFNKSKKAAYIKCGPMKRKELIELIHSRLEVDDAGAKFLIERSKEDVEWLFNVVRKLEFFPGMLSLDILEKAIKSSGTPNPTFSLLINEKRDFLISREKDGLSSISINAIIDIISKAYLLNESTKTSNGQMRVIMEKTSLKRGEVDKLRPLVRFYDRTSTLGKLTSLMKFKHTIKTNKWAALALISRW